MEHSRDNGKICKSTPEPHLLKSDLIEIQAIASETIHPINSQYFTINFFKNHKISICKPLIILKLTLFLFYGAGSFMTSFLTVLYKQHGVSLTELSTMTMIAPVFQFVGSAISGIIADKIGKAKLVFVAHVLINSSTLLAITLLPNTNTVTNEIQIIELMCHQNRISEEIVLTSCGATEGSMEVQSCHGYCTNEFAEQCSTRNIDCWNFNSSKEFSTSHTISINKTFLEKVNDSCQYSVVSSIFGNQSHSWCSESQNQYCTTSCTVLSKVNQPENGISGILMAYGCLYILFLVTYSTSYRCLDVTVMFLVKEYNSSFGHERFFAMLGSVLISPLAGFIANATTPAGGDRNYASAFYLYIALCTIMLPILYYLPMTVKPPSENMWRKSIILLKNPDVISFFVVILFLGNSLNFGRYFLFWYLEGMNASSVLMGLISSVSALYGLPFLLTSHWWVKKIGATQIFILALLGHAICFTGYSFIQDPWLSLVLESTGILTYYLLWVAAVEYSHDVAPEGLTATIIAVAGAIHFSVGKVAAGLMGRFIMKPYGGRIAFRFCAVVTLIVAFLYAVFLCIKNKYTKAEKKLHHAEANSYGTRICPTEIDPRFVPTVTEIPDCFTKNSLIGEKNKE